MSLINERHVDTDRAGDTQGAGNFPSLMDFMNRKLVSIAPYSEATQTASGTHILINSTPQAGTIALGSASEETNGGYVSAALSGAIGTAGTTNINDTLGNVTNLVEVRDSVSHDSILVGGRKVYGLLQAGSTAGDGDAIGASGSENLQVSFVTVNQDGTMVLASVTGDIELALPRVYSERHMPTYFKMGSTAEADVIAPSTVPQAPLIRKYVVTAAYTANEVITVASGAGAGTGVSTVSGDSIASIGGTSGAFVAENRTRVRVNGNQLTKGSEAVYDSGTTFHFNVALDIGDTFQVEVAE